MKSKKIISGLLALTFVLGGTALPNTVVNNSVIASAATSDAEVDGFGYTFLKDGTVEITGYSGKDTEVEIPAEIDGAAVTSIGYAAFRYNERIVSVSMPDSITKISSEAFCECEKLADVKLSSKLTTIGSYAFFRCRSLENIEIPESVASIGDKAFNGCKNIKEITIPASVTSIGSAVFTDTNLNQLYFYNNSAIANNVKTALSNGIKFKVIDANDKTEYPIPCSAEFNSQYHQFRLNWTEVEGAEKYAIAVYLAGKWRPQAYFKANETSFTSPKLKPNTYKMVICARVNGEWDQSNLNSRAFTVRVK